MAAFSVIFCFILMYCCRPTCARCCNIAFTCVLRR